MADDDVNDDEDDQYGGPLSWRYRYQWTDPATVCKGPCEGMGVYPDDGHFVRTGRRRQAAT